MNEFTKIDNNIILKQPECFSLDLTLDCGQAFRWNKDESGKWCCVCSGRYIELYQDPKTKDVTFFNTTEDEVQTFWVHYFDLNRDYGSICKCLSQDKNINSAIEEFYGIRILNQDPWETLCSFIISQNNNIPRIKGIIDRLCQAFGEPISASCKTLYSFPSASRLAALEPEDLAPLRAGFRNKYIIDAARKVASGEVNLEAIKKLPLCEAEAELTKIKGVGTKVAMCALLYGLEQADAFPIDVWVKRILSEMYPEGLPACTQDVRGIAQQYLFHWRRNGRAFVSSIDT